MKVQQMGDITVTVNRKVNGIMLLLCINQLLWLCSFFQEPE